jgi:hypothetical protein
MVRHLYVERGYGNVWTCDERAEAPLESELNALFAGVLKQVTYCRHKTREKEAEAERRAVLAAKRAKIKRREREEVARREADRKRREALVGEVTAWRPAAEIRAYVKAVRAEAEKSGGAVSGEYLAWEAWALGVADYVDPIFTRSRGG